MHVKINNSDEYNQIISFNPTENGKEILNALGEPIILTITFTIFFNYKDQSKRRHKTHFNKCKSVMILCLGQDAGLWLK